MALRNGHRALAAALLAGLSASVLLPADRAREHATAGRFFEAPARAAEFIRDARSIRLTPAQRRLRDRVLAGIPAPCCARYPAKTCCCPCNLARSIWGLANVLIVREGAEPAAIEAAVRRWIRFVNPAGFTGDACDSAGGCTRRFSKNGCGGMDENDLAAAR